MLRIAICDDEDQMVTKLEILLDKYFTDYNKIEIDKFSSGHEIVSAVKDGKNYDLIFMDIEMETFDAGIQAGKEIKNMHFGHALLVFVSGHLEMLDEAFYAEPFYFLRKPIDETKFAQILQEAIFKISKINHFFTYKTQMSFSRCSYGDIMYFKCNRRKVEFYGYRNKKTVLLGSCYCSLEDVQADINRKNIYHFIRIHRSYIINVDFVKTFMLDRTILINEEEMVMTRGHKKNAIMLLTQYLGDLYE